MQTIVDRLVEEQCRRNHAADGAWSLYASHRERVTQLILDAAPPENGTLCLLGCGNLNDVDLRPLVARFTEIVLVDVDADAIQRGLFRQGFEHHAQVRIVAPLDVTGCFQKLSDIRNALGADECFVEDCLASLRLLPAAEAVGRCNVVASIGLLTQLIDAVVRSVGETHARFWDFVSSIRAQHLRLILDWTKPGGAAVLLTEVVSSETCPGLENVADVDLPSLLRRAIESRNFFTGTNPAAIEHLLRTEAWLSERLESFQFHRPWLWTFTARTYVVVALSMRSNGFKTVPRP